MKNIKLLLVAFISGMLFNACSTDFEVAAPYKEIPIVVGMLNKSDSIHYIKVNKAYLNKDGSAYTAGSVLDSNLYPYPLSVKLYAFNAIGVAIDSVSLDTVHLAKDPGTFQTNNVIYATPPYKLRYLSAVNKDTVWASYRVIVRRASDHKYIASSSCNIVGELRFKTTPREIDLYNTTPTASLPEYKLQTMVWYAPRNGKRFSSLLRFRFRVQNDATGEDYLDSVDMQLMSNNRIAVNETNSTISYILSGQAFYTNLQIHLDPLPSAYRRVFVAPLEFHFEFAGEELDTYMEINNSTVNLSDVTPEYTNIDGGLGIFSSRTRKKFNDIKQVNLSLNSISGLKNNSIVGRGAGANDLGFR
jgi:hypothetical protein